MPVEPRNGPLNPEIPILLVRVERSRASKTDPSVGRVAGTTLGAFSTRTRDGRIAVVLSLEAVILTEVEA